MWTFRVGAQQAKKLLFTGELISGLEALKIGLVSECCKKEDLDARVESLA
jgi:enoyl-CoA hydratase